MYRATNRLIYKQPWRSAALAVGAASAATVAYNVTPPRAKLLADSSNNASAADWSKKPTIIAPLASRTDGTGKQRTEQADPNPPSQRKDHGATDPEADPAVAQSSSDIPGVTSLWESFAHFDFKNITENLTKMVVPAWVLAIPDAMHKLQDELSMVPWSLSWEIWEHAHDPQVNPEIVWDANVRISNDLCAEEVQYLEKRKVQTAKALARYLDVPESEVHPDDVPVIAMCGSGGGLRALVAGTSSYFSAQQAGLFDCATYTAGVSGSCWLQTLYYSSIGQTSHRRLIDHFKDRLGVHIAFPPAALSLLSQAPTNKFLLSGIVEKLKGVPDAEFGLVDIYGTLLAGRLLVPKGELRVSDWDLKISNQRYFVDMGDQPLPIYAAVRHEIPESKDDGREALPGTRQQPKKSDYFQWFEWTPYEFFCEELSAGIPTWAVGRQWDHGQNVLRENGLFLPEIKVPLMMGIWGSAFCATLSHYYKEIRPVIVGSGVGGGLDQLLTQKDEDMTKVHPFDPASIPNFALGLRGQLPPTCPESIHTASHLRLMDAGMSNNLPIYPLLRPGRDIDIIVAFDASADAASDNWLKVAEGYARQRKIKGWPMGAGWPPRNETTQEIAKEIDQAQGKAQKPASEVPEIKSPISPASASSPSSPTGELGHCNIWVGCKTETTPTDPDFTPPIRKPLDLSTATTNAKTTDKTSPSDHDTLLSPTAGLTLIYFPLTSNPQVPGVDPAKSDFLSTWNFVYTPEEIESVVALAKANFEEGAEQTRRTVRAVWMRKKEARLEEERKAREMRRRLRLRRGEGVGGVKGGGEGDHFS